MDLNKKVSVIIRSAGERTTNLCRALLTQQVSAENVQVIQEVPFTTAIREGFEIGIDYGLPWTLISDADVLIRENAVQNLLTLAEQSDERMLLIQGKMLDKLMGGFRGGGMRIYRTAYLKQALAYIPNENESIRPESTTIQRAAASHGYTYLQKEAVLGIHDYEQYFHDIYRKAFVHAHKHRRHLPYLQSMWRRLSLSDLDYEVALWGSQAGLAHQNKVEIDVSQFSKDKFDELLNRHGYHEKPPLTSQALTSLDIRALIDKWTPTPEYWAGWYLYDQSNGSLQNRLQQVLQHIGWSNVLSLVTLTYLQRIKYKLQKMNYL